MTRLIVTIDTEEEGRWNNEYQRVTDAVTNIDQVPRFQTLCDRFGIRPTYLVDSPVAINDRASKVLREIADSDRCEIGGHLHPWCTQPFEEELTARNSFLCNLPTDLLSRKLKTLGDELEHAFGERPKSFRAGRYGIGAESLDALANEGYVIDSSVISYSDFTTRSGPNFIGCPTTPYRASSQTLLTPATDSGVIWEVPVSVGYSCKNQAFGDRLHRGLSESLLAKFRVVGILDRLGLLSRIKFSPEQSDAAALRTLAKIYADLNHPCLMLMFHSSSLKHGCTPYTPDAASLEEFYGRLESIFEYCLGDLKMDSVTMIEYSEILDAQSS
ncbi:hypothetical protein [Rhodopirellula sp. MGV]|uniref:hypothetical protein n=1 Tax=Rhodopirellula sp. MGV TaxID=2023130 RepID=UPI000B966C27|nr:hypothetical protein [Rhodopirellula sp. MGV]OYP33017.1 hypothetical protein CGZ80_19200 [Rhodopirellula sp. MGV]PNY35321.1 hypothetical protein C2E31_17485 [Rhodopirellula baltica]